MTGLDTNAEWLAYARAHSDPAIRWLGGDARMLPFADASFDHVLSIAALCFVDDERRAVAEIVRVAKRRFVVGWLNRNSLLYREKGRGGGSGAYRGAVWHTELEARECFAGLPVRDLKLRFTTPAAVCSYCTGEIRIGNEYQMGTMKRMEFKKP